jgi:hypothetical protein
MESSRTNEMHNQESRKMLDMPFWFMQVSMVIGWILMPSFMGVILLGMASISAFVYIIALGKFAKEIGKNPTRWTITTLFLTLLLGPLPIWFSYYMAFNEVRNDAP